MLQYLGDLVKLHSDEAEEHLERLRSSSNEQVKQTLFLSTPGYFKESYKLCVCVCVCLCVAGTGGKLCEASSKAHRGPREKKAFPQGMNLYCIL